jgi:hypothetical protein
MLTGQRTLRWAVAALLAVTAVVFALAVSAERSGADTHPYRGSAVADVPSGEAAEQHEEPASGEAAEQHEEPASGEAAEPHDESGEFSPFGLDLEHPAFDALGVLASSGLAVAVLRSRAAAVAVAAAVFAAGFAALDVVEALHQADEGNTALTATAWALAAAHATAAGLALMVLTSTTRPHGAPATT